MLTEEIGILARLNSPDNLVNRLSLFMPTRDKTTIKDTNLPAEVS